jgi:hypothetical protein
MRKLILVFTTLLAVSCTTQPAEEETIEVRFRDTVADPRAVAVVLPLVVSSHEPDEPDLSPAHQSLFTYLAQTDSASLVTTKPHSQGKWRIEKVFLLDDCVAVQMTGITWRPYSLSSTGMAGDSSHGSHHGTTSSQQAGGSPATISRQAGSMQIVLGTRH